MTIILDDLDNKLIDNFRGYVVKKDLVRQVKLGANVPVFVLEYLIANSCSTADEEKIAQGIENVKKILTDHYVNPEQSSLIHSKIRENGSYKIIDKITVSLDAANDKYWASLFNSNIRNANIKDSLVLDHEKLLLGGIWAIIDVIYDRDVIIKGKNYPFVVKDIQPIQLSTFEYDKIVKNRSNYSKEEWIDVLLRSSGLEPSSNGFNHRIKMLFLSRLIPLVESNFNMVELGPRSTGKSYVYKEVTPYALLLSGGQTTIAQLFVHGTTKKIGAVGLWDTVAFDEVAGDVFKDKELIQILKDYMESGSFSRGGSSGEITGNASMVFNGNINQPIETLLKTSHLFNPFSEAIRNDTAFFDRVHFYLPGWEVIKLAPQNFTNNFGFSTDYFSEVLKSLRKYSYADVVEKYFSLGSHLKQRDTKAVKKTVSGFIKLLHPDGNYSKDDIKEYLEFAIEMRRRVKEQLKRIGGMEFWDTNFSFIDKENQQEYYVALPEERGSQLIENQPLAPGVCYTSTIEGDSLTLIRIEALVTQGSGKLNISGSGKQNVRDNIKNVYQYIKANEKSILNEQHSLSNYDLTIQISPLLGSNLGSNIGGAILVSILSALYKKNLKSALAIIGDVTIGGAIVRSDNFSDRIALLSENGAKNVLVPIENVVELQSLPSSILGVTDIQFYSNAQMLLQKSLLLQ
ncbi:MAG: protease Lon-related BREX system protein BrxL [Ignavibacteriaceae bacterium]|nr:protease Lon-related BREX system protein BrxL [Ignavibacteriaceae bacterium]